MLAIRRTRHHLSPLTNSARRRFGRTVGFPFGMSDDDLIRRIDLALRAQPLPPERLLQRIIQELQRARGGEQGDYYGDDGSYFEDDISFSNGSSRGSSRGGSSRGGSSQFSYDSMASRCVSGPLITPGTPSTNFAALPPMAVVRVR